MLAIFIFVVAYMGYHVVSALSVPIRTNTAVLYKTEETAALSGLIARDEAVFELPSGLMEFRVAEGERVAQNQVIAVTYSDSSAMRIHDEIRRLEARLEQLEYVESHSTVAASVSELEQSIQQNLISVMSSASSGHIRQLREEALELKAALFRREYAFGNLTDLSEAISELDLRLKSVQLQVSGIESYVVSPAAGLFSPRTDGLEARLSPSSMDKLPSEELKEILKKPASIRNTGKGKLVYGIDWYLITELDENITPSVGGTSDLRFSDGHELCMRVYSSEKQNDDTQRVIFSCSEELVRVISSRWISGELILSRSEGIRVPKEAIRSDEEGVFVYCAVISQVKRKPVSIIHEVDRDNYYLVEYNPGSTANLLPGDEMIVAGKDLYDGKILG